MSKKLQNYLSKIKTSFLNIQFSSNSFSSSKKRILNGCKHPKTLSFSVNNDHQRTTNGINSDDSATLSDVDRFLFENFRSLYIKGDEEVYHGRRHNVRGDGEDHHQLIKSPVAAGRINFIELESPRFVDPPPDLCGSNRFFVATGFSSSLIEDAQFSASTNTTTMSISEEMGGSTSTSTTATGSNSYGGGGGGGHVKSPSDPNDCIAVLRYSPSPYDDFRRSMQEMVEARLRNHHSTTIDWDFMEELLFCYLNLNDKKSYKFILSAFVDLVVVLRQKRRDGPGGVLEL